jgi:hypothetical protein
MEIKKLYSFTANQETMVEETEISKNEQGDEVKTIKKVKKEIPLDFAIKKPNRVMFEDAELFYGIRLSESIKLGLLPKALIVKRFENDGGALSSGEEKRVKELFEELARIQKEMFSIQIKEEAALTEIDHSNARLYTEKINNIRRELVEIERVKSEIFEQTAENRARNKTIMWWVLNLAHRKEGDKYVPFFEGETFDQKIKKYDEIEESDNEFLKKILMRFAYLITFWYVGKITDEKDFKEVDLVEVEQIDLLNEKLDDIDKELDPIDKNKESELPPKSE